jgi:hypothetical protein
MCSGSSKETKQLNIKEFKKTTILKAQLLGTKDHLISRMTSTDSVGPSLFPMHLKLSNYSS